MQINVSELSDRELAKLFEDVADEVHRRFSSALSGAGAAQRNPGDEAVPGTPGSGEDYCHVCDGSGKHEGKPCQTCGGTGIIVQGIGGA